MSTIFYTKSNKENLCLFLSLKSILTSVIVMYKRIASTYVVMIFILGCLCVNIAAVQLSKSETVSYGNNRKVIEVSEKRGNIYDCNLKPLVNEEKKKVAAVWNNPEALAAVKNYVSAEDYSALLERLSGAELPL